LGNQRIGFAESKLSTLGIKTATTNITNYFAKTVVLANNLSQGDPNSFIHNQRSAEIAYYFLTILALYLISEAIGFWNRQNFGEDSGI